MQTSCLASDVIVEAYDISGVRLLSTARATNKLPIQTVLELFKYPFPFNPLYPCTHPFLMLIRHAEAGKLALENSEEEKSWFNSLTSNCSQAQVR